MNSKEGRVDPVDTNEHNSLLENKTDAEDEEELYEEGPVDMTMKSRIRFTDDEDVKREVLSEDDSDDCPSKSEVTDFTVPSSRLFGVDLFIISSSQGDQTYDCPECDHRASQRCHLKQHIASVHRGYKAHQCPECDYKTNHRGNLKLHVSSVHRREKPHICIECDYRASTRSNLKLHIASVHKMETMHQCTECDFKTAVSKCLKDHVSSVHREKKPVPAPERLLESSVETTTKPVRRRKKLYKVYQCSECEYKTTHRGNLKLHIASVHRGERPHLCPECNYRTSHRGNLKLHIASVHRGEKSNLCPECDYRTGHRSNLKLHIASVHRGMKPHQCPECDYRGSHRGHLKRHIATVHRVS